MSVSKQTGAKIGLFSAIMMLFGAVVSIGIFFKNNTVFKLNHENAIGIILSWSLSILIIFCMALSFAEISSCKLKDRNGGIGAWGQKFCGKGLGQYAKVGYTTIFYPANTFALLFFVGEALLNCFGNLGQGESKIGAFDFGRGTVLYIFLVGAVLFALFTVLNYFASNAMGKAGNILGLIKFLPIFGVIFLGIIFGVLYNQSGLWTDHHIDVIRDKTNPNYNADVKDGIFQFTGIISSIPVILFAYEGYLVVGNMSGEIDKPEKNLSLAIILGIAIISILYMLITIGCVTAASGSVYGVVDSIEKNHPSLWLALKLIFSILLFICLIGSINAMAFTGPRAFQSNINARDLVGSKQILNWKPNNKTIGGTLYFSGFIGFWWLFLLIPSLVMNNDAIADGSSTSMIVCLYIIYGTVVLGGFINRFTKKVEVRKNKVFLIAAPVGILAAVFTIIYVSFYQFLIQPIMWGIDKGMSDKFVPAGWGMFVSGKCTGYWALSCTSAIVWFWLMTLMMGLTPLINNIIVNKIDPDHDAQQKEVQQVAKVEVQKEEAKVEVIVQQKPTEAKPKINVKVNSKTAASGA